MVLLRVRLVTVPLAETILNLTVSSPGHCHWQPDSRLALALAIMIASVAQAELEVVLEWTTSEEMFFQKLETILPETRNMTNADCLALLMGA